MSTLIKPKIHFSPLIPIYQKIIICEKGIQKSLDKVIAVTKAPRPNNIEDVQILDMYIYIYITQNFINESAIKYLSGEIVNAKRLSSKLKMQSLAMLYLNAAIHLCH